jgi:potassium channel subfamily K, other eukaryote
MNDPGLHEPISEDAKDVENQDRDEHDAEKEDEEAFLEPRYDRPLFKLPGEGLG